MATNWLPTDFQVAVFDDAWELLNFFDRDEILNLTLLTWPRPAVRFRL